MGSPARATYGNPLFLARTSVVEALVQEILKSIYIVTNARGNHGVFLLNVSVREVLEVSDTYFLQETD